MEPDYVLDLRTKIKELNRDKRQLELELLDARRERDDSDAIRAELARSIADLAQSAERALAEVQELAKVADAAVHWRRTDLEPVTDAGSLLWQAVDAHLARKAARS